MPRKIVEMFEGGGEARLILEDFEINMRKTPNGVVLSKVRGEVVIAAKEVPELPDEQAQRSYKVIDNSFGPSLFGCIAMIFGKQAELFEEVLAYSMGPSFEGKTRPMVVITVYGGK